MLSSDRRRRLKLIVAALAFTGLFATSSGGWAAGELRYFTIGTAATGGTYFPMGALIANIISNPPGSRPCDRGGSCGVPGLIAIAQSTQGSVENVERLSPHDLQSALVQSDVASWAYSGIGAFEGRPPKTNLRVIANLYPEDVHIVVRRDSDIRTIGNLRGKRVSLGEKQSGNPVEALIILEHFGLRREDIVASFATPGRAADQLERGEIDAFFHISGSPVAAVAELSERVQIDLLPIRQDKALEIISDHPFFTISSTLPGNYEGVDLTPTLSIGALWLVDENIEEDLVYEITRSLWNPANRALLETGHPRGVYIQPGTALAGLDIPLHPGAERYYRDVGLLY